MTQNQYPSPVIGDSLPTDFPPFIGWIDDPVRMLSNGNATAGRVEGSKGKHTGGVITNLYISCVSPQIGGTAGQNFAGIYNNGTLVAQTADITTQLAAGGVLVTLPLVIPTNLPPGQYDFALLCNFATLGPGLVKNNGTNGSLAAMPGGIRGWSANTGVTALPATLGAKTANSLPWFGWS